MSDNVLLMDKMTKVYPNGFVANKDVTLSVNRGEIHALLGENVITDSTVEVSKYADGLLTRIMNMFSK